MEVAEQTPLDGPHDPTMHRRRGAKQRALRIIALYRKHLEEHPIVTKAITSAVIAAVSDVTSQLIVRIGQPVSKPFSWRSVGAFAAFGLVVSGPVTHCMYQLLESAVPRKTQFSALRKVIIDRLVFAPPYLLALFYCVALLEGKSPSEAWQSVKAVYWSVLLRNWVIWGVTQYINMSYVPMKYRVLFANLVSLVWNIYIAIVRRYQ